MSSSPKLTYLKKWCISLYYDRYNDCPGFIAKSIAQTFFYILSTLMVEFQILNHITRVISFFCGDKQFVVVEYNILHIIRVRRGSLVNENNITDLLKRPLIIYLQT